MHALVPGANRSPCSCLSICVADGALRRLFAPCVAVGLEAWAPAFLAGAMTGGKGHGFVVEEQRRAFTRRLPGGRLSATRWLTRRTRPWSPSPDQPRHRRPLRRDKAARARGPRPTGHVERNGTPRHVQNLRDAQARVQARLSHVRVAATNSMISTCCAIRWYTTRSASACGAAPDRAHARVAGNGGLQRRERERVARLGVRRRRHGGDTTEGARCS